MRRLFLAKSNQRGFTVIELMLATAIFSSLMLLLTLGVIEVVRVYYKGITESSTQNTTRNVMNDIAEAMQFTGGQFNSLAALPDGVQGFCIGNNQYSYALGYELVTGTPLHTATVHQTNYVLLEDDNVTTCSSTSPQDVLGSGFTPQSGSRELLGQNMRLSQLVPPTALGNNLYQIEVRVVYGDDDLLTNPSNATTATCKGTTGSQFCAVSDLTTTVEQRVVN